ncbi:hypothetical protein Bca101_076129 [Brassica carinata]
MAHPSDARAWKHFNKVHPDFASNIRMCISDYAQMDLVRSNVVRQYSLWPVFLTPYNLPRRCACNGSYYS